TFYFPAAAGETFYIRVAALDGETGVYTLRCEKRLAADMNDDGQVNAQDLLLFSQQWLEDQCQASQWCSGADLDLSGTVNLGDYVQFLQYWLVGDN
ncbi:MAG: hypothetical protein JW810_12710, partial [Sedimentisphaerales bacterium]|nr:hypothetical protein [Sedimentisphaerales bacterium]